MNRDQFVEKISLWLDDELSPTEVTELEAHLVTCSSCRLHYQKMEHLDTLFRSAAQTTVAPGLGFSQRFEARLARRQVGRSWQVWLALSALLFGTLVIVGTWAVMGSLTIASSSSLLNVSLLLQWIESFIDSTESLGTFLNFGGLMLKANVILISQPLFWVSVLFAIAISWLWLRIVRNLSQRVFETVEFLI